MIAQLAPIGALLLGSAFLLFAGGLNSIILPVRGSAEGFDALSLGLLGTGWAIGYIGGVLATAPLVGRIGHIRAFGAMSAIAAIAILASLLLLTPLAWIPLRAASGFCFAGAAIIVESWLNEQTAASIRGRVFGTYTMVNLAASTIGQLAITTGDTASHLFFVVCAMFYCLALLPTAVFSTTSPRPMRSVRLDLPALWRNSPVAVLAVFMVGVANSAFGTLAVVYGRAADLPLAGLALFASVPVMAGAIAQIPFGIASDRTDRRRVLLVACAVAIAADLAFIVVRPPGLALNIGLAAIFGAAIFAMYPLMVAHAHDHAPEGAFIQTSGGLLLMLGLGSVFGPVLAGFLMSVVGQSGLFAVALGAHGVIVAFTLWRMRRRAAVSTDDKSVFVPSPPRGAATETAILSPQSAAREPSDATSDDRPDNAAGAPPEAEPTEKSAVTRGASDPP